MRASFAALSLVRTAYRTQSRAEIEQIFPTPSDPFPLGLPNRRFRKSFAQFGRLAIFATPGWFIEHCAPRIFNSNKITAVDRQEIWTRSIIKYSINQIINKARPIVNGLLSVGR